MAIDDRPTADPNADVVVVVPELADPSSGQYSYGYISDEPVPIAIRSWVSAERDAPLLNRRLMPDATMVA
jgi:hypothetical protein